MPPTHTHENNEGSLCLSVRWRIRLRDRAALTALGEIVSPRRLQILTNRSIENIAVPTDCNQDQILPKLRKNKGATFTCSECRPRFRNITGFSEKYRNGSTFNVHLCEQYVVYKYCTVQQTIKLFAAHANEQGGTTVLPSTSCLISCQFFCKFAV